MIQMRPSFTVAAVQTSPIWFDTEATLDKVESFVAQAADQNVELVVFGEALLSGFPVWAPVIPAVRQHELHKELVLSSIRIPGPETARLSAMAQKHNIAISIGVNECSSYSLGTLWNSNLIFDHDGNLVNHRRKLVATWYERLVWGHGDAHDLRPVGIDGVKVGALICGENTNTLAKYAMLAQGEQVHISAYPPAWPFAEGSDGGYDLAENIRLRSAAHSFEGKVYNVVASSRLDDSIVDRVAKYGDEAVDLLRSAPCASMIIGPDGRTLGEPLIGDEGMIVQELDLTESITQKQAQDIVGTYQRLDIFSLTVDQRRPEPVHIVNGEPRDELYTALELESSALPVNRDEDETIPTPLIRTE